MRNRLDTQLDQLNNQLISMGALCENAIAIAVKALMNNDIVLAKSVKPLRLKSTRRKKR